MTTGKIDLSRARELLKRAMETQGPDFVYNPKGEMGCYNIPMAKWRGDEGDDHPKAKTGCLVGTALSLSGVVPDAFIAAHADSDIYAFGEFVTQDACMYLSVAQSNQDLHSTWGEAVERAETALADWTEVPA